MKKRFYFSLFALLFSLSISGQQFDIRAYAGLNFLQLSSQQGETMIDGLSYERRVSGRMGSQYGLALTFGDMFYIQPGLQFSSFNTEELNRNASTGEEYLDRSRISVLSVPLRFGFRIIPPDLVNMLNMRLYAGFDGHHIAGVKHTRESGLIDGREKEDYSNLIVNGDFGMGVDLMMFFFDAGYQLGISPVHSGADAAKANFFYFNLGWRLSL